MPPMIDMATAPVRGKRSDVTANIVGVAERWHRARDGMDAELRALEGDEKFEEFQQFLATTALIAREGRLERYAFTGSKSPG